METRIAIGKTDYHKVGINEAYIKYRSMSCSNVTRTYFILSQLLKKSLPDIAGQLGEKDIVLYKPDLLRLRAEVEGLLQELISDKEEMPENKPDTRKVLGKNIHIYLRDAKDKVISTFSKMWELINDCIIADSPFYIQLLD